MRWRWQLLRGSDLIASVIARVQFKNGVITRGIKPAEIKSNLLKFDLLAISSIFILLSF